ncbi:hypothetical protein PV05_03807 [Exophiala xenobiotica]|uniref:Uncharacterized protein n=1 Tax=Exophiala xenobiotica TaxID=348802 RepID=A0A0D2EUF8_9EURO|nr:uncharacterized protein PV05_03807 [Exophiala xenobiotica]KIW59353.1 hypothetical protein PV05_03807 [Exophiala xenobiotica]
MASTEEKECESAKSAAMLTELCVEQFNRRKALLEEGSSRREAMSLILRKLTKGDDNIEQALENARQKSLALAEAPLPTPVPAIGPPLTDFGLLNPVFAAPWEFVWDFEDHDGSGFFQTRKSVGGIIGFNLHANNASGSCAVAVGRRYRLPHPGLTSMRLSATLGLTYSYGNQAPLAHAHTRAWIGFFVAEFTPSGTVGAEVINQKINLWYLDTDDDFSSRQAFPLSISFPVDYRNEYEIWVRVGGDVYSSGIISAISYANLQVYIGSVSGQLG